MATRRKPRPPSAPATRAATRPGRPPRRRRSAEDARREILDAAEAQLARSGPAAIRLQQVARAVGVSHPTILHHFGSREGLIEAVVRRALDGLQRELVAGVSAAEPETDALLGRVLEILGQRGHARLIAWLLLSGWEPRVLSDNERWLATLAKVVHARRRQECGDATPPYEDTQFTVLLAALALFADGVAGDAMRESAGVGAAGARRFRGWLAQLLIDRLQGPLPAAKST